MTEKDYLKLRKQIDERYRADVDALNRIWGLSNKVTPPSANETKDPKVQIRGHLVQTIREIIPSIPGKFTVHEIERRLIERVPEISIKRTSLSQVLKRLLEDEKIINLVEAGVGRAPSVYISPMADLLS